MANTRGKTHVHGPTATGTISAGNVSTTPAPGVHGSGANAGKRTTITPGAKAPPTGRSGNPTTANVSGASSKKIIHTPVKTAPYAGGKGVGAGTPVRRKKTPRLGT